MDKVIIVLDGSSEGKNIFKDHLKRIGFWTWNVNSYNVVSMVTYKLGYSGERNKEYYDFINQLKVMADTLFDFERSYTVQMIEKFLADSAANVLLIHRCSPDLSVEIQDYYPNCYNILVSDSDIENVSYCKTLNFTAENYADKIVEVMKILTDSKEK